MTKASAQKGPQEDSGVTTNPDTGHTTGTIVKAGPQYDEEALLAIGSFDDAIRLAQETLGGEIVHAHEVLGTGFAILEDKSRLVGVPLVVLGWQYNLGDNGQFVSLQVVTQEANGSSSKYIVNDGSTGIMAQCEALDERGWKGGILCRRGLRVSTYGLTEDNEVVPFGDPRRKRTASTYYLDTSA